MKKPSWEKAPEWANWVAMDIDGSWSWYEEKPKYDCLFWSCVSGREAIARLVEDPDPEETLEQRPQR
jgi:hypothetical protein